MNKAFKISYLTGIFLILLLPLLSLPIFFHPPAWSKEMIFRSIFSILLFIFAYQILFKDKSELLKLRSALTDKKSNIFIAVWALLSLLALLVVSTIFSADPYFSLWGSPLRGGGAVTFIFLSLFCLFTFLFLNGKDWNRVWITNIIVGFAACVLAVIQKFGLFQNYLAPYAERPVSTFGGSIFFALYLVLIIFMSLSFGINSRGIKRILYFFCSGLFLFCLFLSGTRSALLGFAIGIAYFILFFPYKNKKITWLKIGFLLIIAFSVVSVFFLKTQPGLIKSFSENKFYGSDFTRIWNVAGNLSIKEIYSSRASGWTVAIKGILERPLLGWGPENFAIPFDKYYDSTLPGLLRENNKKGFAGEMAWWDKGHSFVFDYASTIGIPFLLAYLLFNGIIFWKLKKMPVQNKETQIISHSIQATIIGYLVTNFFNFDVFETYLIYFLLVGYSFYLLTISDNKQTYSGGAFSEKPFFKKSFIAVLFVLLIWFLWSYNIRPLQINKGINDFTLWSGNAKTCDKAISTGEKLLLQHSIIDNYLRLSYIDALGVCLQKQPAKKIELSYKVLDLVDECIKERPTDTRTWLFQGVYAYNILNEENPGISGEEKNRLFALAYASFPKAKELSPKRQIVYMGWAKTDLLLKKYDDAMAKADECISLNTDFADCLWIKSLVYIDSKNIDKATETLYASKDKKYFLNPYSENTLSRLVNAYSNVIKDTGKEKYYEALMILFENLIYLNPTNPQYHASLAYIYKNMGMYDKARQTAQRVLEISPALKSTVEAFLKTLPD